MKKNILQIMPYFPPHIGGVEKVGEEIFLKWTYGKSLIFSGNSCQQGCVYNVKVDNKDKYFFDSIDIVDNFPFPRLWTTNFWGELKKIRKILKEEDFIIITHTRFFFSSFMGGVLAKIYKKKWIHIEHGSDYVKLSSVFKSKVAYIYDRCIGKWVFKNADNILAISEACKNFVEREFGNKNIDIWYRGMDFEDKQKKYVGNLDKQFPGKTIIGYIGRLYKWKNVHSLCEAYISLSDEVKEQSQLVVIGGGEEFETLSSSYEEKGVYFTGALGFSESYTLQGDFDIHVHPSSPGGGLATTLLQAMNLGCMIVATPNEGAKEVIIHKKNGFLLSDDSISEMRNGIQMALENISQTESFARENKLILDTQFNLKKNIEKLYNLL